MADAGTIAIVLAGFGVWWWRLVRPMRRLPAAALAPDAEIALHVASHVAGGRPRSSLDLLYGLLQDDQIAEAVRAAGGDPAALTDQLINSSDEARDDTGERAVLIARAIGAHAGRAVGCTDLWAQLGAAPAARWLAARSVDVARVLHVQVHGGDAPDASCADGHDVLVVLRNDPYTTQELVCEILRDVFERSTDDATAIMLATHHHGRAVVGRFTATAARDKVSRGRQLARSHGFPLWIGVEPS